MNNQHETSTLQRHRKSTLLTLGGLFAAGAIVVATLGLGGGKSDAGNNMASMAMSARTPGKSAGASTPVATDAVDIKNFAFSPSTITVQAGSTVVWTNADSIQHDITFDGASISSSVLNHNDTFSHTFTTAGTYHYICSIHPFMHGTVIVTGQGSQHANATQPQTSSASGY
ncbi:MAG TPA: cupredoxin family copper-binding protein [Acidimicrobiia bacterium]|jgi:amicyanin|nr:cupredoxin family copper-binding protein [Acidimicrobiia bacterium]